MGYIVKFFGALLGNKMIAVGAIVGIILSLAAISYIMRENIKNLNEELADIKMDVALKEAQLRMKEADLEAVASKLDLQNEKIRAMGAQNERLREERPKIRAEIEAKYKKLTPPSKESGCEKKLKFYEDIFKELGR